MFVWALRCSIASWHTAIDRQKGVGYGSRSLMVKTVVSILVFSMLFSSVVGSLPRQTCVKTDGTVSISLTTDRCCGEAEQSQDKHVVHAKGCDCVSCSHSSPPDQDQQAKPLRLGFSDSSDWAIAPIWSAFETSASILCVVVLPDASPPFGQTSSSITILRC